MNTSFAELGLNEQILAGVDALGFDTPTPVQAQAIPVVLEGRDVVASAQTGTGKTAAFALPALQLIQGQKAASKEPLALVVTPTRELAAQIDNVVSVVCKETGQRAVIVMGGAKFDKQIAQLEKGCDLLVATPGRLLDLMEHNHVSLSKVQVLVLDEADRMLDMGFWPSVRRIMHALPESTRPCSSRQPFLLASRARWTPC
jgi:ATP-dependent RNA helicase RhlE